MRVIFRRGPGGDVISPWEELVDSLGEASKYLQECPEQDLVAYEIGPDGEPTGVKLEHRPLESAFLLREGS